MSHMWHIPVTFVNKVCMYISIQTLTYTIVDYLSLRLRIVYKKLRFTTVEYQHHLNQLFILYALLKSHSLCAYVILYWCSDVQQQIKAVNFLLLIGEILRQPLFLLLDTIRHLRSPRSTPSNKPIDVALVHVMRKPNDLYWQYFYIQPWNNLWDHLAFVLTIDLNI